jgi:hypothetical protein
MSMQGCVLLGGKGQVEGGKGLIGITTMYVLSITDTLDTKIEGQRNQHVQ